MGGQPDGEIELEPAAVAGMLADGTELQLIDVRESYEREAGHIAGSQHIELTRLSQEASRIARERPIVFYCRAGGRSLMAAQALRAAGYEAYSMSGGLVQWAGEGRALEPEDGHVAEH